MMINTFTVFRYRRCVKRIFFTLFLASGCLFAGCLEIVNQVYPRAYTSIPASLLYLSNKAKWNKHGLTNYSYSIYYEKYSAELFSGPFLKTISTYDTVFVENNQVVSSAIHAEVDTFHTVEEYFDYLARVLMTKPQLIRVSYDLQYGYPTRIEIYNFVANIPVETIAISALIFD